MLIFLFIRINFTRNLYLFSIFLIGQYQLNFKCKKLQIIALNIEQKDMQLTKQQQALNINRTAAKTALNNNNHYRPETATKRATIL